jgi:catechol 2,3-dioxygenase-like lactoylglutathione lyase family enzyme
MLTRLTAVGIWVTDQEEALAFYTGPLGFELREDVTLPEFGGYRWLTVGPPGQPDIALILNVPGAPLFDEETTAQVGAVLAKGGMGGMMLACDDCRAAFEELSARGVEFHQEPVEQPYGIDAGFRDPFGNSFRLVQRTDGGG